MTGAERPGERRLLADEQHPSHRFKYSFERGRRGKREGTEKPFTARAVKPAMQDIRYALRSLRKQPIFALVAVATLTLGIGANTAIFSLLYQYLLRPLPYPDAERLVFVWNTYPLMGLPQASVSIPDYIDRKTQASAIEDATLFTTRGLSLAAEGEPVQVRGLAVTPSFFSTLRRQPFLGRGFAEGEAQPGADKFAILTYNLWNSRFAADRSIVGRSIRLGGEPYQVVGVLPADFELPSRDISVLVPFAFTPEQMSDQGRGNEFSQMIARLAAGRDDRAGQRADEDDRRSRARAPAAAAGVRANERLRRLCRADPRSARRRSPDAALLPAGLRAARAAHRLRERRQPALDARDRPLPRARDPDDARGGAAAVGPPDADRRSRARRSSARSAACCSAWPASARSSRSAHSRCPA